MKDVKKKMCERRSKKSGSCLSTEKESKTGRMGKTSASTIKAHSKKGPFEFFRNWKHWFSKKQTN